MIHHVNIILYIDPGRTEVEILPTSKYHILSLFILFFSGSALGLHAKLIWLVSSYLSCNVNLVMYLERYLN